MLLNQHTMLFEPDADLDTKRVGILDPNCIVSGIVEHAFNQASFLCEEYYLVAPELDMTTHKTYLNSMSSPGFLVAGMGMATFCVFCTFRGSCSSVMAAIMAFMASVNDKSTE